MPPRKTAKKPKRDDSNHVQDDSSYQQDGNELELASAAASAPPPPIPSEPSGPISQSYTYASSIPSECSKVDASDPSIRVPCVLGVDEAGRGPVLGPLVYGIAYCPVSYQEHLKLIGFADSKALTAERRDTLLSALIDDSTHLGWSVRVMSPQDISAGMLRRRPVNLNAQSSQATVSLIARVLQSGVDVTEIYVDTVGDPKSYSKLLSSHFPRHKHIKWTVTSKADAIYPIVGAASIAAKVTRDRCIDAWKYAEQPLPAHNHTNVLGDTTNHVVSLPSEPPASNKRKAQDQVQADDIWSNLGPPGSGYPGDPNTVAFLKRTLDPVFGWPGIVRFSWATAKTMLDDKVKPASASSHPSTALPAPLGAKRLTRSLSRTSSFTEPPSPPTTHASTPAKPTSIYGTLLPQPAVVGGTATRGYKVKWIDEPVSISKFFGPKKTAIAQQSKPTHAEPDDVFQTSQLQSAINDWLKQESPAMATTAEDQLQINIGKLDKDLGLASANAAFCL